jgi:rubrerythrin
MSPRPKQTISDSDLADWFDKERNVRGAHEITSRAAQQVAWLCPQGHRWYEAPFELGPRLERRHPLTPCPVCSAGLVVRPGPGGKRFVRSVPLTESPVVAEWHATRNVRQPADVTTGSRYRAWWQCSACGHQWQARVQSRARLGSGCPNCVTTARHHPSLRDARPDLYAELLGIDGGDVGTVTLGSVRHGTWRCSTCGHEWTTSIALRARGTGCPSCAGRKTTDGSSTTRIHPTSDCGTERQQG